MYPTHQSSNNRIRHFEQRWFCIRFPADERPLLEMLNSVVLFRCTVKCLLHFDVVRYLHFYHIRFDYISLHEHEIWSVQLVMQYLQIFLRLKAVTLYDH